MIINNRVNENRTLPNRHHLKWLSVPNIECPGLRAPELLLNLKCGYQINALRQMMQMDPPMAKFTKNDGIVSLMHCQECIFHTLNNGSQLKNLDISGVIFTLSLSILIQNSQFVEGAKYVRVHYLTPITIYLISKQFQT